MNRAEQIKHAIMKSNAFNESHAFAADYIRNCSLPQSLGAWALLRISVIGESDANFKGSVQAYVLRAFDEK